jgi:glutamate-1-semialdehyde 2,1-aminomutase
MAPGVLAEPNGDEHKSNAGYHDDQGSELADKLRSLVTEFVNSNPKSQQAFERARKALPGGNTRSVLYSDPLPLVIRSGRDCYVTSVDGREYVDFLSDFSAGMYGHSHPTIKQAVTEALETGFSLGGLTEKEAQLGELIKQRIPSMELIRFCNSGTEANTMALALAVAFTGRKKVRQSSNP